MVQECWRPGHSTRMIQTYPPEKHPLLRRFDRAGIQVGTDALFDFGWELRHRSYQLLTVNVEHNLSEHRKRNLAAGFVLSEGTVVVKADADGDGDSFAAVCGAHEQCIPEIVRRSCLAHNRYREFVRVKRVCRAGRHAHDTTPPFLNERQRAVVHGCL